MRNRFKRAISFGEEYLKTVVFLISSLHRNRTWQSLYWVNIYGTKEAIEERWETEI